MRSSLLTLCSLLALAACGGDGGTTPDPQPRPQPEPEKPAFRDPPESAPREITPGVPVQGEALSTGSDTDEFAFNAPASGMVAIVPKVTQQSHGVTFAVIDSATNQWVTTGTLRGEDAVHATFAEVAPGRRWLLRVYGAADAVAGPYTLTVHTVDARPEAGDSVLPPGAWVNGTINHFYDVDDFVFDGVAGQEVNLSVEETDPDWIRWGLVLRLRGPDGVWLVNTRSESNEVRLPATGRYRVRMLVDPASETVSPYPYRIQMRMAP